MLSRTYPTVFAALMTGAVLATACGDGPIGVSDEPLDAADAGFLASRLSGIGEAAVDEETAQLGIEPAGARPMASLRGGPGFLRARACPAGGELEIDGEIGFNFDGETLSISFEAVKTMVDCAFERAEEVFIVNGSVEFSGSRTKVNGEPFGLQETHIEGSVTILIESTGEEKACEIDIIAIADPEAGTREVTGTFCGHDVGERGRPGE